MSNEVITTVTDPRLVPALEANLEEEMMYFGRTLTGAEVYNDGEIEGFYTGHEYLNGILRTHLRETDPQEVQTRIATALAYFRARQVNHIAWTVGQDSQPRDLATHLELYGFHALEEEDSGMALDIVAMRVEAGQVEDLEIRELTSLSEISLLYKIEIEGFDSSEEMASYYCEMYRKAGLGPGTDWRHFCAWRQGEAVASASLLFHAGVAGLYGVATLPCARRQGIARALVLHAIAYARQAGYHIAILSPTSMSAGIYQRLGFREYTRLRRYICDF